MPRNSQGLYTLPPGNPVVANTIIEAEWANPTMDDIADALTLSLPRDGSAPMTGPLILTADPPISPTTAATKQYVDEAIAGGNVTDAAGLKNKIINGCLGVWQRSTGQSRTTSGWTADRWYFTKLSGTVSVAKATPQQASAADQCKGYNLFKIDCTSGSGVLTNAIEGVGTLANGQATMSYKMKYGTGTDTGGAPVMRQDFGTGGSPGLDVPITSDTITNLGGGYYLRQVQFNVPSIAGKILAADNALQVYIPFAGTFDSKYFFDFQLERGAAVSTFDPEPIGVTLMVCERYFQKISYLWIKGDPNRAVAFTMNLRTDMRAVPAVSWGTPSQGSISVVNPAVDLIEIRGTASTGYDLIVPAGFELDAEL